MKMIVGLGNPGDKFVGTRHNIGFAVVEDLAERYSATWQDKPAWSVRLAQPQTGVILIEPQTFMNESGRAVRAVAQFFKLRPEDICLVYDDRDLPFGSVRWLTGIRTGAHHNGVRSVAQEYSREVERLRIGIGNDTMRHRPLDEFVLARFTGTEASQLPHILTEANQLLSAHYNLDEK